MKTEPKKLMLIGSSKSDVHLKNYYNLIADYFDEILIITGNEIDYAHYRIIDFGLKNPISMLKNIRKLSRFIKEFSPSIIHVHQANSIAFITSLANKKRIPQVLTTWGSDVLLLPKKNAFFKYVVRKSLMSSNSITADASYMREEIEKLIGPKVVIIANFGINHDELKADITLKENLIYSNRLHNNLYNIDQILIAFKDFQLNHPSWKLIIAGNGLSTEKLKQFAHKNLLENSYEFVGFVDTKTNHEYYKRAKIYVSVPSSDGTSISLLEAMAFGTIPVLSDLPANNEWVKNMENGIIVKNTLTKALNNALTLNQFKVAKLNAEIIESKASKKANKRIFESIYDELLD